MKSASISQLQHRFPAPSPAKHSQRKHASSAAHAPCERRRRRRRRSPYPVDDRHFCDGPKSLRLVLPSSGRYHAFDRWLMHRSCETRPRNQEPPLSTVLLLYALGGLNWIWASTERRLQDKAISRVSRLCF